MRDPGSRAPWSMTVWIMSALVAVFAATRIDEVYFRSGIDRHLMLSVEGIQQGEVWRLLTFQFLHGGLMHLVGNLLGLWFCGRFIETVTGPWRFLLLYLGAGVFGGLLQLLLAWQLPAWFGGPVLGASAGVMALVALFCLLQPEAEFLVFFVVPVKARVILIAEVCIAVFFTLVPERGGAVAHAAHLGGIIAAVFFFRARWHDELMPLPWQGLASRFRRRPKSRPMAPVLTPRFVATSAPKAAPVADDADYISREVDPILDKIAAHGLQSLTEREKKVLQTARDRMVKR